MYDYLGRYLAYQYEYATKGYLDVHVMLAWLRMISFLLISYLGSFA